jgi:hypothetical protein
LFKNSNDATLAKVQEICVISSSYKKLFIWSFN